MKPFKRFKFLLIPVLGAFLFISASTYKSDFFEIAKQIEIFTTLFKELNMNYVDETNPAELMDSAIKHMLNQLDPYTQFYNEQDVESELIRRTGDYTGVGARVKTFKDKLLIMEPYKGYPADKAGLKAGDEIIEVDGIRVSDYNDGINELLRGSSGSSITVKFKRKNSTKSTTITREEVDIDAVPFFDMVNENTGYIVLSRFNRKASEQTANALKILKERGASSIILDLRNNPGGLLSEAVNIVNLFVPKNQLVVTTKSKIDKYNKTYYTKKAPLDTSIPVAVLINENSASASEIVSGTLQDLDRAVVVGTRSFGKGLVQRPKPLTYGTQLKITISRYYTPSGRSIQALDYIDGLAKRFKNTDYKAFKTKHGRTVYSGGGILPDVVLDHLKPAPIIKALEKEFLIFDFATQYYYNNPNLKIDNFNFSESDFNSFKQFLDTKNFSFDTKTETTLKKAFKYAEAEELSSAISNEYNAILEAVKASKNKAIDTNKHQIKTLLTQEIIKRYVYNEGYYSYFLSNNEVVKDATKIVNNTSKYNSILKP